VKVAVREKYQNEKTIYGAGGCGSMGKRKRGAGADSEAGESEKDRITKDNENTCARTEGEYIDATTRQNKFQEEKNG
jgi:hypothetical protein